MPSVVTTATTRRELLTALLGASVAAGCRTRRRPVTWDGGFAPRAMGVGHRLIRGEFPPPSSRRDTDVLVLGGGVSGLTAAWQLLRARPDLRVSVVEVEDRLGGTSAVGQVGPLAFPWGAHYLPAPAS